jgi:serine/threonine-protein kinase RsbW
MASEAIVRRRGDADLHFVEDLYTAFEELWQLAPSVPAADRDMFALAVIEIATNIATHTAPKAGVVTVEVELSADDALRAVLRDDGVPADVDLTNLSMADALSESGRGLAIAAAVCDELSLERRGGNVWRLRRGLGGAE